MSELETETSESAEVENEELPSGRRVGPGGPVIGTLIGFRDGGRVPLVIFAGQPAAGGVDARAILDLHGAHIGREVLLGFEEGDVRKPIVLGCMWSPSGRMTLERVGAVELQADGERMIISAQQQLVLRCGKASITLTCDGKILIEGEYVSSRSSGVNRIKGGSVQLN